MKKNFMAVAKFNMASEIAISRCLESINANFYYGDARINKVECLHGNSPDCCQYYIVRIEYLWGNLDVYHFAAKMDGSGQIDYINIHPETIRFDHYLFCRCFGKCTAYIRYHFSSLTNLSIGFLAAPTSSGRPMHVVCGAV